MQKIRFYFRHTHSPRFPKKWEKATFSVTDIDSSPVRRRGIRRRVSTSIVRSHVPGGGLVPEGAEALALFPTKKMKIMFFLNSNLKLFIGESV